MNSREVLNILMISPESWGTCKVSKHHYAEHLASLGHRVFFLAPKKEAKVSAPKGIELLDPPRAPRGMRFFPPFWRKRAHRKIGKKLSRDCNVDFDRIWTFDTSWLFDLRSIAPKAFTILHLVDLSMEFEWKVAASEADLCLGSSKRLKEKLGRIQRNSHFIHHGYSAYPVQNDLLPGDKAKVVYAGNLTIEYLDRPRLMQLIETYPHVDFHFFGDQGKENLSGGRQSSFLEQLREKSNAHLHEAVSPEKLASYYASADVLLLCYDPAHRAQISNPHKVMEYLGSGKPILSTHLEEYAEIPELITMIDDVEEYVASLEKLIAQKDEQLAEKRKAFAASNTYSRQIERIESLIAESLKHGR